MSLSKPTVFIIAEIIRLYGEGASRLLLTIAWRSRVVLVLIVFYYGLVIANQLMDGVSLATLSINYDFIFLVLKWAAILIPSIWFFMMVRIVVQRLLLVLSYCREESVALGEIHSKDLRVLAGLLQPLRID